ncbi:MAG TPA: XdhC family protein [Candidatus Sulfomarinibacteraceae bacterium]|nr:XdhC family protein [Candidatus Sulfomarinibacteraceae bacterium]
MFDDFYARVQELEREGRPFVTATVVRAEAPTSGKPGDKAIVTVDGVMYGWIGGSCAQPTIIKEALEALRAGESRLIRLSPEPQAQPSREGVMERPMTCYSGGTMEVFVEPHHPRPRLLIVGALPIARALSKLGAAMNYEVVVVSPDGETTGLDHCDRLIGGLDEAPSAVRPFTYVVVATHGNYDERALELILKANPGYVGLVASPTRGAEVRDYLLAQGLTEEELLPLKAPAGIDIQAQRGDEIALSIMAEIVQKRRNAELLDLALFSGQQGEADHGGGHEERHHAGDEEPEAGEAIDPVCHMTVQMANAAYTSEYQGQTYYFCCAGCKSAFEADPVSYEEAVNG